MVASTGDPYTAFLPPVQNKIVNDNLSGSFSGVGIEIGYRDGSLAVIAPLRELLQKLQVLSPVIL